MNFPTYPKITDAATDSEIVRLWISQKAITTQKTYVMVTRQFLEFTGKALQNTKLEDLLLWLESFKLRSASQNTINNKLAALKSLFGFCVKTGYLTANPAALIKTIKAKDTLNERLLQASEVKRLIEAAPQKRDRCILKLLYVLGLRVSELVGLSWGDFREIDNGVTVAILGKGLKTRTLLIDKQLWAEIQQLPRAKPGEADTRGRIARNAYPIRVSEQEKSTVTQSPIWQ